LWLRYAKEAFGLLRPDSEEEMDRNIWSEHAWPSDSWSAAVEPSPSVRSEPTASLSLSRGEALILVLSLSFGLWAIWGAIYPAEPFRSKTAKDSFGATPAIMLPSTLASGRVWLGEPMDELFIRPMAYSIST
jgi:hypothetical protein